MNEMQPGAARTTIAADDVGIHFMHGQEDIVVVWGEIAQICASHGTPPGGEAYMTVYVDHYTGVDFRFQSVEPGYAQTTTEMEKHLIGFSRTQLEAVPICHEIGEEIHLLWKRDETIQPFQLQPEDTRDPTLEELAQMEAARHASIATSARLLGRPLTPEELECIQVWFENGHIMGSTAPPLSDQLREQVNKLRNPGT